MRRKTDTLAILGAGPSINHLRTADLDFLARIDTIGTNNWVMHDFVPNYYMREALLASGEMFLSELRKKARLYEGTTFFFKCVPWFIREGSMAYPVLRLPESLRGRVRCFRMRRVRYRTESDIDPRLFADLKPTSPHPQSRGSIEAMLSWGMAMGYERIILYGIDLTYGYFWEQVPGRPHRSTRELNGLMSMDQIIPALNRRVLRPRNIELFVASPRSRLYPAVPVWKYQTEPVETPRSAAIQA